MVWPYRSGIDLESAIEGAIEEYEGDRSEYWHEEGHSELLKILDSAGGTIITAAQDLITPQSSPDSTWDLEGSRALAEVKGLSEFVLESIQIAVAREFCTGSDAKAQRALELAEFALTAPAQQAVRSYLRRLGRCYVAGLDAECTILCRAVLENSIAETFQRKGIPLPATPSGASPMRVRLEAMKTLRWLSNELHAAAWKVWKRGSKAAHEDPDVTREVFETIQMTMAVISHLYDA